MRFAAATSSANEVSGSCTIVTLKPSLVRISYTGFQPDASTQAPWTRTMFLTGSAARAGTIAETRKSAATVAKQPCDKQPRNQPLRGFTSRPPVDNDTL